MTSNQMCIIKTLLHQTEKQPLSIPSYLSCPEHPTPFMSDFISTMQAEGVMLALREYSLPPGRCQEE